MLRGNIINKITNQQLVGEALLDTAKAQRRALHALKFL